MELGKYHSVLLRIIKNAPNASPQKIDRLFYQFRIDEGVPFEDVFSVSWAELMSDLKNEKLVESNEKSLTKKGVDFLLVNE
jgi:hypothetical protein